ncbi:EAL domain-containing protein [Stenotrophomonas rhizophila]|uniref:EAL domain-containing protein n=1 Tax=Stenotrophomonas rhizophila TaxID=216778 RepID=UPI001E523A70|nr:EAL domain-containing protein [Stenotrophomonas rhizophila]MCC7634818.1 EAL domain-containing protein [Stenotrophomonas rhizophila]MCC7664509.1 EAL domain-containing protein [Stenotrophomonas rhizophila]
MQHQLGEAFGNGQLRVCYDPILDLGSGRICAAQAQLCWQHPCDGVIGHAHIQQLAQHAQLSTRLDQWWLDATCRQLSLWQQRAHHDWQLSLPVSSAQLCRPQFVSQVEHSLSTHAVAPTDLRIAVDEAQLRPDFSAARRALQRLSGLGVGVVLGAFRFGYATLPQLQSLPLQELGICPSLIAGIEYDPHCRAVVSSITSLARALTLKVLASGVSTATQQAWLAETGIDAIQGRMVGSAGCAAELSRLAREQARQQWCFYQRS